MNQQDRTDIGLLRDLVKTQHESTITLMTTEFERVNKHLSNLNGAVKDHETELNAEGGLRDRVQLCEAHVQTTRQVVKKWPVFLAVVFIVGLLASWSLHNINFKKTLRNKTGVELNDTIK